MTDTTPIPFLVPLLSKERERRYQAITIEPSGNVRLLDMETNTVVFYPADKFWGFFKLAPSEGGGRE